MLAKVFSSAVFGIEASVVEVEVDIARGLPSFSTVGLPDGAVRESKDRVKAAIRNSGYEFPPDRITVNMAPADTRKEGAGFDLPIALGILAATGVVDQAEMRRYLILGELSLYGEVKPVKGSLPVSIAARDQGYEGLIIPRENAKEAAVVTEVDVLPVSRLSEVVEFLNGDRSIPRSEIDLKEIFHADIDHGVDFSDVKGQQHVKRCLEVAAAGGHNVIMIGPPGSGKTMLSRRLPTILPDMSLEESLETTKIHSVAGLLPPDRALVAIRPFRSPHHTISDAGLIGGGTFPRPGEVSLAHNGVLFLDELPEFRKNNLEMMRQPLEDGTVTIARASTSLTYPSRFMLVAAMNPCPCGYYGDPKHECSCTVPQIQRYRARVSGPLLDRIDIQIEVPSVRYRDLTGDESGEASSVIRERVNRARDIQLTRFKGHRVFCNGQMTNRHIKRFCPIGGASQRLLEMAIDRLGLSARAYVRIVKAARTIADLEGMEQIAEAHISEAIQYRSLDRTVLF